MNLILYFLSVIGVTILLVRSNLVAPLRYLFNQWYSFCIKRRLFPLSKRTWYLSILLVVVNIYRALTLIPSWFLSKVFGCYNCMSVWVASGLYLYMYTYTDTVELAIHVLSAVAVTHSFFVLHDRIKG